MNAMMQQLQPPPHQYQYPPHHPHSYQPPQHQQYPQYGFAAHKGYGTAEHLAALQAHGACPEHRRSFSPVARVMVNEGRG